MQYMCIGIWCLILESAGDLTGSEKNMIHATLHIQGKEVGSEDLII